MSSSPHRVVLASAGTGKTFRLANRFIALVARGEDPASILATTFTRKAAGEILARILDRLALGAEDAKGLASLREHADPALTHERCLSLLRGLVDDLPRLNVRTIDALLLRIASGFALEVGLLPGWRIVEPEEELDMRSEAVVEALRGSAGDTFTLLRLLQGGRAGSLVHRQVLGAVENAYDAYLRCGGSPEPWERFGSDERPDASEISPAIQALERAALPVKADGSPDLRWSRAREKVVGAANAGAWQDVLSGGLGGPALAGTFTYRGRVFPPDLAAACAEVVRLARIGAMNALRGRNRATHALVDRFHRAFLDLKSRTARYHFDDVPRLLLDASLIGTDETGVFAAPEQVYYRLDARIRHILLDEFQDTSMTQFRLLLPILEELLSTDEGGRSVFCVGDVKQSLYAWREAEPALLPSLRRRWPQLEPESLDASYRSSSVVIDLVNRVMGGLVDNPAMDSPSAREAAIGWCRGFPAHRAARDLPGEARLSVAPEDPGGDRERATLCAGAARAREILHRAPGATIAILLRRNKFVARAIYELRERGVAASEEGGNALTDAPPVAVACSLLRLIDHPGDSAARFHVATSPIGRAVGIADPDDERAAGAAAMDLRRRIARDGIPELLSWIQHSCAGSMDRRGFDRFTQLIDLVQSVDSAMGPGDLARLVQRRHVEEPGRERVRVMTIHKAKGLEFDAVILPELDCPWKLRGTSILVDRPGPFEPARAATTFPNKAIRSLDPALEALHATAEAAEVSQELCALYVALTRAVHSLDMILQPPAEKQSKAPTPARLLRGALARGKEAVPGAALWSACAGDWLGHVNRRATPAPADTAAREISLAPGPRSIVRRIRRRSPSSLEGGARIDLGQTLRLAPGEGRVRGSLVHEWFERVEWLEDGAPDDVTLSSCAAVSAWAAADIVVARADFRRWLADPAIAAVLRRARYEARGEVVLRREWPFAVRDEDGSMLVGRFDRLVVGRAGGRPAWAEIIDFKTDTSVEAAAFEARLEHYRPQAAAYRRAAARMFSLAAADVSALLVFCSLGRVVPA